MQIKLVVVVGRRIINQLARLLSVTQQRVNVPSPILTLRVRQLVKSADYFS